MIIWFLCQEKYLYAVGFANKRLHQYVSFIFEICLVHKFSHIAEDTWISSCAPSISTNSSWDQTSTIMNTQVTRENTCTSASCTNDLYDAFSTRQFSKLISNANGSHDIYRKILDPYPHDVPLKFLWVPNGWKLNPI